MGKCEYGGPATRTNQFINSVEKNKLIERPVLLI